MINGMVTAVAALLYNSIYDLSRDDGAWTIDDPRDDQAYLAFAESLIAAKAALPSDAHPSAIIEHARRNTKASLAWNTIIMDDRQELLTEQCSLIWHEIEPFLDDPNPLYMEYEFLEVGEEEE